MLAVGNPFDLGGTATAGIVSAYNRDIGENFVDYIQIDAPINRGNSGGPTFDIYGRVIGVNTAIFSPSGGSVGIGFAIPADVAEQRDPAADRQAARSPAATSARRSSTLTRRHRRLLGPRRPQGRAGRRPACPAARPQKAGLQPGDVVVAVNGHAGDSQHRDDPRGRQGRRPATSIHLDVYRDGKERTVDVRSGLRPSEEQLAQNGRARTATRTAAAGAGRIRPPAPPVLGMQLGAARTPTRRSQFNIRRHASRAAVVARRQGHLRRRRQGPAARRRDRPAGDREVASAGDVAAAVADWKKAGRTRIPLGSPPRRRRRWLRADQDRRLTATERRRRGARMRLLDRRGRRRGGGGHGARPDRGRPRVRDRRRRRGGPRGRAARPLRRPDRRPHDAEARRRHHGRDAAPGGRPDAGAVPLGARRDQRPRRRA